MHVRIIKYLAFVNTFTGFFFADAVGFTDRSGANICWKIDETELFDVYSGYQTLIVYVPPVRDVHFNDHYDGCSQVSKHV